MMIFGIGTGRSGTTSLARLINAQDASACFHEANPSAMKWEGAEATVRSLAQDFSDILENKCRQKITVDYTIDDKEPVISRIQALPEVKVIGDIAYYYLPYVEMIIGARNDVRFPCVKRERQAVVDSYVRWWNRAPKWRRARLAKRLYAWMVGEPYRSSANNLVVHNGKKWERSRVWEKTYPKFEAETVEGAVGQFWDYYYDCVDDLIEKYPDKIKIIPTENLNDSDYQKDILEFCGIESPKYVAVHENRTDTQSSR